MECVQTYVLYSILLVFFPFNGSNTKCTVFGAMYHIEVLRDFTANFVAFHIFFQSDLTNACTPHASDILFPRNQFRVLFTLDTLRDSTGIVACYASKRCFVVC